MNEYSVSRNIQHMWGLDVEQMPSIAVHGCSWEIMDIYFLTTASRPGWKLSKIGKYLRRSKWISAILVVLLT
jgi:hypothetical protein